MKRRFGRVTSISFSPAANGGQRGMALVFALVVLLILTILGLSSLRTSSLEQLMSGNAQEQTRAFESADSGLSRALNAMLTNTGSVDPSTYANTSPFYIQYSYQTPSSIGIEKSIATATAYQPKATQIGPAPRSSTPSGSTVCAAYYDQAVTGTTAGTLAQAQLHQGIITGAPCPAAP